jgi:RNA polymerase sigma-70 factor (ECF subfamily)
VRQESNLKSRFKNLFEEYGRSVRRLCSVYASAPADREDLFQEIFLGVWRALPAFRDESSERTWLYRIAHNVALTWQGRDRRRLSRQSPLDDTAIPRSEPPDVRRMDLERAVAQLNRADRSLTLLWLEGLTAREIEEVTGVLAATVAVRLSRIRKQLTYTEVKT